MTRRPEPPLRLTELGEFLRDYLLGILVLLVLPATYTVLFAAVVR